MKTYEIPRNYKGEGRILFIFSTKALIYTVIGAAIGLIFYFIFSSLKMKVLGILILAIFALLGYAFGTVKMPRITGWKFTKNIEGDSLDDVFIRYLKFRSNKKIYTYTKEED